MSEELVEELADRIRLMIGQAVLCNCDVSTTMARECLRQMEWIRSECFACVGGAAEDTGERISDLKLTLAPPDWKAT